MEIHGRSLSVISTRELIALRNQSYTNGGYVPDTFVTIDDLKAELSTREHIPNKQEAKILRQKKSCPSRDKKRARMKYDRNGTQIPREVDPIAYYQRNMEIVENPLLMDTNIPDGFNFRDYPPAIRSLAIIPDEIGDERFTKMLFDWLGLKEYSVYCTFWKPSVKAATASRLLAYSRVIREHGGQPVQMTPVLEEVIDLKKCHVYRPKYSLNEFRLFDTKQSTQYLIRELCARMGVNETRLFE